MKHNIIVPLLVASIAGGVAATTINTEQRVAHARYTQQSDITNVVGNTIEISNFESKAELGEPYTLPTYVVKDEDGNPVGLDLKVVVTEPSGRRLSTYQDLVENEEGDLVAITNPEVKADGTFTPNVRGYYEISFEAEVDGQLRTVTEALRVFVEGEDYTITLPTNSKYVVPSVIPTSTTNALKIPVPTITLGGEEYDPFENEVSGLEVYVLDINGQGGDQALALDATKSFYEWMPTDAGVYEIVYKYVKGTVQDYKTQRFTVREASEYDTNKIVLNFSYASSRPTTAILGVETELPKINVVDKNTGNAIEAYTHITVRHVGSDKEMKVEDFKFTPTERGNYVVTYTAKLDYFANVADQTHSFIIENVRDTQAPTIKPTNPYDLNEEKDTVVKVFSFADNSVIYEYDENRTEKKTNELLEKALSNLDYAVPSVVRVGEEIKFPAAFATDNVSKHGKLTYTRSIRNENSVVSQISGDFNSVGTYTFPSSGDYSVRYIIKDEAGNERTQTFNLKVVDTISELNDENDKLTTPTVVLRVMETMVRSDGKITFTIPTATDQHDSRLQVKAFYKLSADANAEMFEVTTKNSSGQYVLDLSQIDQDLTGVERVYIVAQAFNDYNETPGTMQQSVRLLNTTTDFSAPEFELGNYLQDLVDVNNLTDENDNVITINPNGFYTVTRGGENYDLEPFNQKDIITLPAIRISDDLDPNLGFKVEVRNPEGRVVNISNTEFRKVNGATNTYELKGSKFVAAHSGIYTVTYTATDSSGNMSVKSYGIRVRDTEKPRIELNSYDAFLNEVQVGEFVYVPRATIIDNGRVLEDHEIVEGEKYEIDKETGERKEGTGYYKPGYLWTLKGDHITHYVEGLGFAPGAAGEYVIVYEAWDENGNTVESSSRTVVAKDTLKPTIELEKDLILPGKVEFNEGEPVVLPGIANYYDGREGTDNDFTQTPKSDIKIDFIITDSNGVEVKGVEEIEQTTSVGTIISRYQFTPTKQSVYTIKYIATDNVGNRTEIVKTLEVGDVYAPTFEFVEDYEFKGNAKLGDHYTFNLSDLVIEDDVDEFDDIKKQVTLRNPNRSTVANSLDSDEEFSWKLEHVGEYELRIVLTDSAGNSKTQNYTINVTEDEGKVSVISENAGVILVAVTAVVLAGVVVYFIVSGKGGKSKGYKGSNRTEDKNKRK